MLFSNFTYQPTPAAANVRLTCTINKPNGNNQVQIEEHYQIHPQHRNRTPIKSQWAISCDDELSVFAGSVCDNLIINGQYMWGIYIPGAEPEVLGVTRYGDATKLAIFDNGGHNGYWHGYPADYIRGQEIPTVEVFDLWRNKGTLTKADINKIIKGQW